MSRVYSGVFRDAGVAMRLQNPVTSLLPVPTGKLKLPEERLNVIEPITGVKPIPYGTSLERRTLI